MIKITIYHNIIYAGVNSKTNGPMESSILEKYVELELGGL